MICWVFRQGMVGTGVAGDVGSGEGNETRKRRKKGEGNETRTCEQVRAWPGRYVRA